MKFKFLEHTADIKFQAFGKSLEEVFSNCALALIEVMTEEVKIKGVKKKEIVVAGKDNENLLYEFLEEFLVLLDSENFVVSKIESVKIENGKLKAVVLGDDVSNYKFGNDVKAITYNEMFVKEEKGKWVAQVVLDV
jgi:protein archease